MKNWEKNAQNTANFLVDQPNYCSYDKYLNVTKIPNSFFMFDLLTNSILVTCCDRVNDNNNSTNIRQTVS